MDNPEKKPKQSVSSITWTPEGMAAAMHNQRCDDLLDGINRALEMAKERQPIPGAVYQAHIEALLKILALPSSKTEKSAASNEKSDSAMTIELLRQAKLLASKKPPGTS